MSAPASDAAGMYRSLFAAYPDALLLVDGQGTIVLANPAAEALLGYAEGTLCGLGVDALVPDAIRPRHAEFRAAYAAAPRTRPMGAKSELVARRADGTQVTVEIALSPLHDRGLPYVVAAVRDVGAYPRVRQALQRARYSECIAQLGRLAVDAREPQELLERLPAAVCETLAVDSAAVFLLDADHQQFRLVSGGGAVAAAVLRHGMPNHPDGTLGQVVATNAPLVVADYAAQTRFVPAPEVRALGVRSCMVAPLSDHGRVIGAIAAWTLAPRDFGAEDLRFVEALANLTGTVLQRAESEAALRHAQRLETVGQLTGGIAHDFNNLLTVIQGNLQVLEDLPGIAADPVALQMIAAALRAGRRGADLTGKLLAFSRRQVLQPGNIDVDALLRSLADMLHRTLDKRIRIEVEVPTQEAICVADSGQLESALLNIAINARDAMPEGGWLSFSARVCDEAPGVDSPAGAGYVAISVADTGAGMSEAVRARAFEPFFTTKEAGRGTGLGLSTVYGFVRQSQGSIAIDSAPGDGTTVTLFLPRPATEARPAGGAPADCEQLPPGLQVLLVEDDAEVRSVVRILLQGLGCEVEQCENAEQALDRLARGATPGLLLSDIALGIGMRGTELAQRVRERHPWLPVLLMSGYASMVPAKAVQGMLLRKPFSRAELARAISRLLSAAGHAGTGRPGAEALARPGPAGATGRRAG